MSTIIPSYRFRPIRTSSGFVCCSLGRSWWASEACKMLSFQSLRHQYASLCAKTYLEGSSKTEDTVVCLLLRKTLEGKQDSLGLFGDQVIGSVIVQSSAELIQRAKSIERLIAIAEKCRRRCPGVCSYLNPSFLYPAALQYQLANGVIHLFSQGRFTMKFVMDG